VRHAVQLVELLRQRVKDRYPRVAIKGIILDGAAKAFSEAAPKTLRLIVISAFTRQIASQITFRRSPVGAFFSKVIYYGYCIPCNFH
jgi:hypothetical protein